MKFSFATIHVRNMKESITFYETVLGLKLLRQFPAGPSQQIAFLGDTGAEIELIHNRDEEAPPAGSNLSLGFEVPSAADCLAALEEKGITIQSGPFSPNPGTTIFFILDPNGIQIELIEQNH